MKPAQVARHFNRLADAYAAGVAPHLYDERGSIAVRAWGDVAAREGADAADCAVEEMARSLPPFNREIPK